jgi:Ala-tRNA(Pro) deacylase
MSIAKRLKWYLDSNGISYECVHHARTRTSLASAREAHVPASELAKCVLLEDERGYVLAVLPASCRLDFDKIEERLHRRLELASEPELRRIFRDCATGAVPAFGNLYGVPTLLDNRLLQPAEVFFEAGDHEDLVHLSGLAFRALLSDAERGEIGTAH